MDARGLISGLPKKLFLKLCLLTLCYGHGSTTVYVPMPFYVMCLHTIEKGQLGGKHGSLLGWPYMAAKKYDVLHAVLLFCHDAKLPQPSRKLHTYLP